VRRACRASHERNSLRSGKLSGNLQDFGPLPGFRRPTGEAAQSVAANSLRIGTGIQFRANRERTRPNREEQEIWPTGQRSGLRTCGAVSEGASSSGDRVHEGEPYSNIEAYSYNVKPLDSRSSEDVPARWTQPVGWAKARHRNRLLPISTLIECRSRASPTSVRRAHAVHSGRTAWARFALPTLRVIPVDRNSFYLPA
jgi:hypothetical protein